MIEFRFLVLAVTPVDVFIVLNKLYSLKKDKDIKTKRKLLANIIFSSQILDSISRCISCIIFFMVQYVDGFVYTLCLGPILIT